MFEEDEEELELLRQYEDKALDADEDEGHSSDGMDSDLEDKIMSMVQYGSGISKKKPIPAPPKPETRVDPAVVYAPTETDEKKKSEFSASNELQLQEDDESDEPDLYKSNNSESEDDHLSSLDTTAKTTTVAAEPTVTRYINLDDKQYIEDQETSEEEAELGLKLQELIEEQIYNRQSKKRFQAVRPIRVCFVCNQPGHERRDCTLCIECGLPRHKDTRCTGSRYCSRCKRRGHNAIDCEYPKTLENCPICNASYHHKSHCPALLHTYFDEVAPIRIPEAWCYNCTSKGHYGDDCPYLPNYLTTIPSAFSKLSIGLGSRFDVKKSIKNTAAAFGRQHDRWSNPSSRESSPNKKKRKHDASDTDNSSRKRHYDKPKKGKLNDFFDRGAGNSNWKALNNNQLPQPTRSGTVNVNTPKKKKNYDFPRSLPKPSSSGVIDLTGEYSKRTPKYRGGYNK